jgi:mRNA interferase MazF
LSNYKRGDVVIVPFPYSGAPGEKPRPALVLASVPFGGRTDYIVCISSSQDAPDPSSIPLAITDITTGVLRKQSYLRPCYLFTTDESRISRKVGSMKAGPVVAALKTLAALFTPV